jgi:RNA polymerase sigma factor (sigma-70 family)
MAERDRDRFEALYRTHYGAIVRFAARRTDPQAARDVAAETFLVAWRRLDAIPDDKALPWLYGVARKVLSHERRSRSRHSSLYERLQAELAVDVADPADGVVDHLHARRVLDSLPPKHREALQLTEWEHLDIATAARVAGCSAATFRVRLHRARRRLADAAAAASASERLIPSEELT